MSASWSTQAEYEAIHGTQAEQAARQASIGRWEARQGVWYRLERDTSIGQVGTYPSAWSTRAEAEREAAKQWLVAGIRWRVVEVTE